MRAIRTGLSQRFAHGSVKTTVPGRITPVLSDSGAALRCLNMGRTDGAAAALGGEASGRRIPNGLRCNAFRT